MKLTILSALFCAAITGCSAVAIPAVDDKPLPPIQANLDECKNKKNGDPCRWHSAPNRPQLGPDGKGLPGQCLQITLKGQKPLPITCYNFALW